MGRSASDIEETLMMESEEFQKLSEQHRELDARLKILNKKHFLTDDEKLEETTIKKKKLAIKDRMAVLIRSH
jgi:uncharacterized protein YdcH (DUF465 family)